MSKHLNRIALAAIAISPLALAVASAPAAASPTLNFSIVTNQFSKPTMEFEYQGGKYVWKQQVINTQFSATADTNDNAVVWAGALHVDTVGGVGKASFTGTVPVHVVSWKQSGPIAFPVNFLSVYQSGFASYCDKQGGQQTHVSNGLTIPFQVRQAYVETTVLGGIPPLEVEYPGEYTNNNYVVRNVNMPMTVVCLPKPAREIARPGGVKQETPDFKVKSIALNYGGAAPTKVNPTTVCKSAKLSVVLHTSKAGVVDVKLHKKIGAAPIQAKSMQLYSKFDGNAHFVASYVEYIKVSQPTLVQAMAEEFNSPLGQTTGWKDVTLHCENANGGYAGTPGTSTNPDNNNWPAQPKQPKRDGKGGLATTPGTSTNPDNNNWPAQPKQPKRDGKGGLATTPGTSTNPDNNNWPAQPKQPKRVFDGAKNLAPTSGGTVNPDSRNAPKPFKPVIAPATPKKPVQERHGHLWPAIQKVR